MRRLIVLLVVACVSLSGGCSGKKKKSAPPPPLSHNVLLWISVDGLRGDYIDRVHPPFLTKLMRRGAYTRQLRPVFPSLTFPSHLSEATGVLPGVHGIPANAFYDGINDTSYNFPDDASLVQAEPFWQTAQRQGLKTAVFDWPMSQHQERLPNWAVKDAYFNEHYDTKLSDDQRLGRLLETYREDGRCQVLMGYVHDVDTAGHRFGPDSPQVDEALLRTDRVLERVVTGVAERFARRASVKRGDRLFVMITTDHGMTRVQTLVNVDRLLGDSVPSGAKVIHSGSIANVYLDPLPRETRGHAVQQMLERLGRYPFLEAWSADSMPEEFGYSHPTRTGDVVISLKKGYAFTSRKDAPTTLPAGLVPTDVKGMHGYRPDEVPEMLGFAVLCDYGARDGEGSVDLGELDALRLHPTAAAMMDIAPAPGAHGLPINLRK